MNMGGGGSGNTTTYTYIDDLYINSFLDMKIAFDSTVNETAKWDILTNKLQITNYLESNVTEHLTLREIMAKNAIYNAINGTLYSAPIDVTNPLAYLGDPRERSYINRDNVRRNFFDLWDNSKKAPTNLAL